MVLANSRETLSLLYAHALQNPWWHFAAVGASATLVLSVLGLWDVAGPEFFCATVAAIIAAILSGPRN